ncbi:MAG: GH92 family glycosyl hydrolase [Bacteroidetes bacterium]|nr:GH92 family glycosyl hydrolase [Bacteroidota bacterium]
MLNLSKLILLILIPFQIISCAEQKKPVKVQQDTDNYIQFVNPFIGTKNMGHTFPGATVPFGAIQLSPETNQVSMYIDGNYNPEVYSYCAGYQYEDSTIFGFSHTHFSGTGHSDLGDLLIMPTTGKLNLDPGDASIPHSGYFSSFSHANEFAEPAYYRVYLDNYHMTAELTATERVGFHRYTFPKTDSAHIILDLMSNIYNYDDKNVWTFVRVENDSTVTGYRQTTGWARTRTVYFVLKFSKPFNSYGHKKYDNNPYKGFYRRFNEEENFPEMAGKNIRAYFNFDTEAGEQIRLKAAISSVSTAGALNNLETEIPHWEFETVKNQSQEKWNKELSKIEAETLSEADKTTFYTALYHTLLGPTIYEDVDGSYRGLDMNVHHSKRFTNYTTFSLWDTYRALHPLFNIIQPARNNDMIKSMLSHRDQSVHQMLPIWSHHANENWCMIGYHAVSVIADAIIKGTTDINPEMALQACINTSTTPYFDGLDSYMELGYVPEDKSSSSVSKTLEFAYDDWCISQLAKQVGDTIIYQNYLKRSENFKNVFNTSSGFMQPRLADGSWKKPFDPLDTHGQGFIEGNAWNYGLYVPHDIDAMIEMMGGSDRVTAHLDSLFNMELDDKYIENTEDITRDGIIGNYVQGNEPGQHIPYLYNWTDAPWKTQERVRMIMRTMYGPEEDGLCGNDDAGQMSAWYVFSALGFYPVCPGSDQYALGSPLVKEASIYLENGKSFSIKTVNQSEDKVYVENVELNGTTINRNFITHNEIINGGELTFYMSERPNLSVE